MRIIMRIIMRTESHAEQASSPYVSSQSCFFVNLTILSVDVGSSQNDVRFVRMSRQLML